MRAFYGAIIISIFPTLSQEERFNSTPIFSFTFKDTIRSGIPNFILSAQFPRFSANLLSPNFQFATTESPILNGPQFRGRPRDIFRGEKMILLAAERLENDIVPPPMPQNRVPMYA